MSVPPGSPTGEQQTPPDMPMCFRHSDRRAGVRCARCERPACPDCLREASVGYHCVDCVNQARRTGRQGVTVAGAQLADKPLVVPALIAVNVLVFVLTAIQAGSGASTDGSAAFHVFALTPFYIAAGAWWQLVTNGFLHVGLVHLAMNMIALWVIGRDMELLLGKLRFAAVYTLALLGGAVAVFLFGDIGTPTAGASGAVYGLMGGIAVAALRLRVSMRPVLIVIGLNIVLSVSLPGISLLGHLGGLVLGGAATAALVYAPRENRLRWQLGGLGGLLLVLVALTATRYVQLASLVTA